MIIWLKAIYIFNEQGSLDSAVRKIARAAKCDPKILHYTDFDELLAHSKESAPSMLIIKIDKEELEPITIFLQKFRKIKNGPTIPIVIFAKEMSVNILAIGTEYSVNSILPALNIETSFPATLSTIIEEYSRPSNHKQIIIRLEKAQANGNLEEIDMIVREFYSLFPSDSQAMIEFANLCIRENNWEKAAALTELVCQKERHNIRALNIMAKVHMHNHDFVKANSVLNKAELLSPKNVDRLCMLGDSCAQLGKSDEAEKNYKTALSIDENSDDAKCGLGIIELTKGMINQALTLFRDTKSDRELGSFFNNAGIISVKNADYPRGEKLYESAIEALKSDSLKARVMYNLGLAYKKWKKVDKAIKCLQEAHWLDETYDKPLLAIKALKMPNAQAQSTSNNIKNKKKIVKSGTPQIYAEIPDLLPDILDDYEDDV